MNDLVTIHSGVVQRGFPEFAAKPGVLWYALTSEYPADFEYHDGHYHLFVDVSLGKAPVKVVGGVMAHELSHLVLDNNRNIAQRVAFSYLVHHPHFSRREERLADEMAVKRGFADELQAYEQWMRTNPSWSRLA